MVDKEDSTVLIKRQEVEILDLKETLRLRIISEDIEVMLTHHDLFFSIICQYVYVYMEVISGINRGFFLKGVRHN